ncbi:MAG TPA: hypothetical protein PKU80_04220 [Candidatus Limiplasma sp.]|nr:hypothetical protein [Candidatus Limiplasma sp.]HRX08006.1 hypothetical protein [Candidatus Limiplasma sp.]
MIPTHDEGQSPRLFALLAKEYAVRETRGEQAEALEETAQLLLRTCGPATADERKRLQCAVETLSQNRNTVVFDDSGLPSIMVRVPAIREKDVLANGSDALHPAFSGGQDEFLVGKYLSSDWNGHACSLPLGNPIFGLNQDAAIQYCKQKGKGWHVTPFALRMAIAMQCRRQGFLPNGNSMNGSCYLFPQETGLPAGDGRTLCGSGPLTWSHDGTPDGLYDLSGNLNEWDIGYRLMDGEIQIIPIQALLAQDADLSVSSPLWRALDADGCLALPGSPDTLKYDAPYGQIRMTRHITHPGIGNCAFADLQTEPGLTPPLMARLLGLYPEDDRNGYGLGWRWINTSGEGMPLCGGAHRAEDHAGVFFVGATYPRTKDYALTGFRILYNPKEGTQ